MKIKITKALTILPFLLLSSCSNGAQTIDGLDVDPAKDYVLEDVSNQNGSMSYEIFVRTFYDSDGNGIGDLNGVKAKLPYLSSLGIKTLWLMPIHPSPSYHGYDVRDYYDVNPQFGTLSDFDSLVAEANKLNIDIMLDMVFNHCSNDNQYFIQSYNDFKNNNTDEGSKKDWFSWSDQYDSIHSNKYKTDSKAWYEGRFSSTMPDFNFNNQEVKDEIENIMKFWIVDHGVKGFRLDAVKYYYFENTEKNNEVLTWLEETARKYDSNFYMVGECWDSSSVINKYHESELDSFFRFDFAFGGSTAITKMATSRMDAYTFADDLEYNIDYLKADNPNGYPSFFISNHDQDRATRTYDNENQEKAAASLLALLPGTSFMYYGEEIGLLGRRITSPKDDASDARRRLPMVWSETDKTGECVFPESDRQDLNNNEQVKKGVNDRLNESFSLVKHYQKAINIRNKYPFIKQAKVTSLVEDLEADSDYVLAYKLYSGNDYIIVVHNFSEKVQTVSIEGSEITDSINTTHLIPKFKDNKLTLGGYSTVVIK
ncbi:MAG: hypothetical protein K5925_03810 [Bacilli bacterium]|nr:hypothetical protein [Bacilli bacterium]